MQPQERAAFACCDGDYRAFVCLTQCGTSVRHLGTDPPGIAELEGLEYAEESTRFTLI